MDTANNTFVSIPHPLLADILSVWVTEWLEWKTAVSKQTMPDSHKMRESTIMAGALYFIYIILHTSADVVGRSKLIVYGDAAATAQNIMASAGQFRIGFIGDLLAALLFFLAAWALYVLLKPVNKNLALLFLLLNLSGVILQCASDLFLVASQMLLSSPNYLNVFQANQLQALAMFSLYLYKNGFMIAQLFYGAWLFPLGYLVFKSGFIPRILGVLLMLHCAFWLMTFLQFFLFPAFNAIIYISYPLGFVAEFGLSLWLIIMGVKIPKPA
jgi:hypothetical protein